MGSAFHRFLVDLEGIALLVQHVGQRCPLDAMSPRRERLDQVGQRMRRPFEQAHRIPFGLQQLLQIPLQGRIRLCRLLPAAPDLPDPSLRSLSLSFELFDPSLHGFPVRSRERCYLADASRADLERFCSQIQAPLLFIQFVAQDGILLLCRHALILPYFSAIWKLFTDGPLAYDAGLRREELCTLSTHDIDPAHRLLHIRAEHTKGRRARTVPYSEATGVLYMAYLGHRCAISRERGPLFLSESRRNYAHPISIWTWSKVIEGGADRSGVPKFTTHTWRHLCLTETSRSDRILH